MYTPNLELWAFVSVDSAGAIVSRSHNVASVAHVAASGIYDVSLATTAGGQGSDWGVDASERGLIATINNAASDRAVTTVPAASTDSLIRVQTTDLANAAADAGFTLLIVRKRP